MNTFAVLELLNSSELGIWSSDDLRVSLSKLMKYREVNDGQVIAREGEEMKSFFVLADGVLARFKHETHLIDTIEGKGRVTGFMHAFASKANAAAFATVKAQGPAKVYECLGEDVRVLCLKHPQYSLEIIQHMAVIIRNETKISRALRHATATATSALEIGAATNGSTIRVLCYDANRWVRDGFNKVLKDFNKVLEKSPDKLGLIVMEFTDERLNQKTATFAAGYGAVCTFVNDTVDRDVISTLSMLGVFLIAQRAAGIDRIDIHAARAYGMTVARVPSYSPYSVAEMAITLLMAVVRKITQASNRVRMANFTLDEGLLGMDIYNKTIAVMGTGRIGRILCKILNGFGANLICYDVCENEGVKEMGGVYLSKDECFAKADIIFLMMPLLPSTKHIINMETLPKLKNGVILINTSRGGLIETKALLEGLKTSLISGVGMDVYENEADYFFQDWSARHIPDSDLVALLGNHAVVLTSHQAFFTKEAVEEIVLTTLQNVRDFASGKKGLEHPNNCLPKD